MKLDERLAVYFSGIQTGLDGSQYIMLQYKYESDANNPPAVLIKVIFDGGNKILGIQPIKRM